MNKSTLKAEFINAKIKDAKYIGVSIKTEGSSQPEIVINPRENFDAKFDYYMEAYDDDLILIAAKGKKDIRIVAAGHGNRFEDIENQLIGEKGKGWRELIAGAIDNAYDRLVASTPPQTEEEKTHCEMIKEAVKGMFINESRTAAEAEFIKTHTTHVTVRSTGRPSTVLCEQVYSVSTERIGTYIGECSDKEMENIDIALMISLQLDGNMKTSKKYNETIKEQQEEIDLYRKKIQAMQEALKEKENEKPEITASSEETIRLQTERDTYKTMYEQLLNRLVNGGAA